MLKVCTRCNIEKPLSAFYLMTNRRGKKVITPACISCSCERSRERRQTDAYRKMDRAYTNSVHGRAGRLVRSARTRATAAKMEFNLSLEQITAVLADGKCQVTGIPFIVEVGEGRGNGRAFGPSLDRIDNTKGYTPENTQVVCWIYNRAKGVQGHREVMKLAEALCQKS